uniref:Peptidase M11 gametolysin domain-containing protein n=2 Tax=Wuchereria bancrofti TaxID=6293 RepID=A0A1I8F1K1_WUCBA
MLISDYTLILIQRLPLLFLIYNSHCNFYTAAIPQRTNEPWSVILCKFADTARYEPQRREWYQNWMTGSGTDTIAKYFMNVSNGIYTITDTKVFGWVTLPWTVKQVRLMALADKALWNNDNFNSSVNFNSALLFFIKAKQLCVKLATQKTKLNKKKITILNTEHGAMYGNEDGVLITPRLSFNSVLTHEMVHSFHIGHSYSDRKITIFPFAHMGEYGDRYDLMSTSNAWMYKSQYGLSGPGLNGPHLDYLGWLPSNRILYFGREVMCHKLPIRIECAKDGRSSSIIRLSSLSISHAQSNDWLLVMLPFDKNDPANVFTLEFRTPKNYDSGIKQVQVEIYEISKKLFALRYSIAFTSKILQITYCYLQEAVVIHKIDRKGTTYYSTIITHSKDYDEMMVGTEWVHFLEQDSPKVYPVIKVRVERIDKQRQVAVLQINSTFSPVKPNKISCKSTKTQRHLKDEMNSSHIQNKIDTEGETIRILPPEQNRFFKDLATFGMNACNNGYVWRMIDPYDYACVTKNRQQEIRYQRKVGNPSGICHKPLMLRKAFPSDTACVTRREFTIIQKENAEWHKNMKYHSFFNGEETVVS